MTPKPPSSCPASRPASGAPRPAPRPFARALARVLLPEAQRERVARLQYDDAGHGYDALGLHPDWVAAGLGAFRFLYESYFRVESHGTEHLPARGPAILVSNHSGTLPLDGAMIYLDVQRHTEPPRVPRTIVDRFVPLLPFAGLFFARAGAAPGTRENLRFLLEAGELVLIFPEGTPGVGKRFRERYRLQGWRVGHAETAIAHGVPIVPVAVIGAEEQWPQLARLPIRVLGAPYLPVPATPLPLPVRYHIHYGAPIHFGYAPEDARRPEIVQRAADRTRAAVEALIARGLRERKGVFQ
ncbi:MAG: acyltransferase family protein [Myxococcales bacterium]|nr:acyltransferase family protein [Myxococcales bacterium]MBL0194288.1 acyltransferase family protein [Myxococcales bacterium]HQY60788.1 lysophospholipid acyltransferase family protein [Polyangiaceae bacterium]